MGGAARRDGRRLPRRLRRHPAHHQPVARRAADREPAALGRRGRVSARRPDPAPAAQQAGDSGGPCRAFLFGSTGFLSWSSGEPARHRVLPVHRAGAAAVARARRADPGRGHRAIPGPVAADAASRAARPGLARDRRRGRAGRRRRLRRSGRAAPGARDAVGQSSPAADRRRRCAGAPCCRRPISSSRWVIRPGGAAGGRGHGLRRRRLSGRVCCGVAAAMA